MFYEEPIGRVHAHACTISTTCTCTCKLAFDAGGFAHVVRSQLQQWIGNLLNYPRYLTARRECKKLHLGPQQTCAVLGIGQQLLQGCAGEGCLPR
jgi:hypothetical protein